MEEQEQVPVEESQAPSTENQDAEPNTSVDEPEGVEALEVSFGEDPPPQEEEKDAGWVKNLRKQHREAQKELRDLKAKLASLEAPKKDEVLGEKPTLDGCGYDTDEYDKKLLEWDKRKREFASREAALVSEREGAQKAWQEKVARYEDAKAQLQVDDFEEAEHFLTENFSEAQRYMIIKGIESPELMVYALAKYPAKAKELAKIQDPLEFAFQAARLEAQLKTKTKRTPPPPEPTVKASGKSPASADASYQRLMDEADRTGNYTAVAKYLKERRSQTR